MKIIIVKSEAEMGKRAANLIAQDMKGQPHYVLGLATGGTPLTLYKELVRRYKAKQLDFSTTISFNLDEYVGLKPTHPQSYRSFMNKNLFKGININLDNTHVPDGMAKDLEAHCLDYEDLIDKVGGIDCQVLGIGNNGHIAFNEPGSSLASRTRVVKLTKSTIDANKRFFKRRADVPTRAVTMGIGTILEARKIVLLACGSGKTAGIAKAIEGPITAQVLASALQLHPAVTFVITKDAATGLTGEY